MDKWTNEQNDKGAKGKKDKRRKDKRINGEQLNQRTNEQKND
jgi:hypothetical protein